MLARARILARAKVDAKLATMAAKARTLAKAREAAQPMGRNHQPTTQSPNHLTSEVNGKEGRQKPPALITLVSLALAWFCCSDKYLN
jgi:hypothetical protein